MHWGIQASEDYHESTHGPLPAFYEIWEVDGVELVPKPVQKPHPPIW